jgi:hypothetical protein
MHRRVASPDDLIRSFITWNRVARRSIPPPKPRSPTLTVGQKRRRIERLQKCITSLEAILRLEKGHILRLPSSVMTSAIRSSSPPENPLRPKIWRTSSRSGASAMCFARWRVRTHSEDAGEGARRGTWEQVARGNHHIGRHAHERSMTRAR